MHPDPPAPIARARSASFPRRARRDWLAAGCAALLASGAGCKSASEYAESADQQVYALVEERRLELFDDPTRFRIEPPADSLRQRLLAGEEEATGALDILDCLRIAAETNRDYQEQREALYLAALDVTLERWRLGWIETATAETSVEGRGTTGTSATASGRYGLDKVLGTGARLLANVGLGLVRFIGSGGGWDAFSDVSLSITQPLLRGAGGRIVFEPLTQSERDLVYQVRSFERFRRTLAVDVAERVYRILQQVDAVKNQRTNTANLEDIRKRNEALSEAGRLSDIQVDQASQDELRSRNRLLVEEARLQTLLDDMKLFLGLPIEVSIGIDQTVLDALEEEGVEPIELDRATAVQYALGHRLDYLTALDRVGDAERRVFVAADALRPGLDVSAAAFAFSDPENPLKYNFQDTEWVLGLQLDLPIDNLPERNLYRRALVTLQASTRTAGEVADTIQTQLREDLRLVQTSLESYEIQVYAEQLAARRVESTRLNLDAGRATTRDILEAQEALLTAQNATTQALVEHTLARLALFTDMELLRVTEEGIGVDLEDFLSSLPPDA